MQSSLAFGVQALLLVYISSQRPQCVCLVLRASVVCIGHVPAPHAVVGNSLAFFLAVLAMGQYIVARSAPHSDRSLNQTTNIDNVFILRCAKVLDRGSARLCCLAKDCENPEYTQLVRALCDEGNVHLIMVSGHSPFGLVQGALELLSLRASSFLPRAHERLRCVQPPHVRASSRLVL